MQGLWVFIEQTYNNVEVNIIRYPRPGPTAGRPGRDGAGSMELIAMWRAEVPGNSDETTRSPAPQLESGADVVLKRVLSVRRQSLI